MIIHNPILTGSFTVNGTDVASITSSAASITAINSYTASQNILNGTYATTGSNTFAGIQTVNSNLVVTGSITAQTLVVQTITSSVDYVTGSTRFGSLSSNTHTFTGSIYTSGSINIGTSSSVAGVVLNVQSTPNAAGILINNPSSASYTGFRIYNDQASANRALEIDYAGSAYASALVSGGITGESAVITTTGAYPLQFGTSNTFRMAILANGNVGIGVTSPNHALAVNGSVGFYSTTPTQKWHIQYNASTDGLNFVESAVADYRMFIKAGGNVGIGLSNPSTNLAIKGTAANPALVTYNGMFGLESAGQTSFQMGIGSSFNGTWFQSFNQPAGGGGTFNLIFNPLGGSVSIGSTSTPYNFNVYGASAADGWGAFFGGAGNTKGGIYLGNAGTQYGTLYFDNANNNVYLKQSYASGNVSVIANTGGVYLANGGTSWTAISSDIRKKKNFETVPGLDAILQVEPVKYHFLTDDDTATKRLGFKAQNIQPLIPEMVLETGEIAEDGTPYLTVTPDYILPVLVKAIQELQAQITELKNK